MNILMLGRWVRPRRQPVRATREYQFAHHLARSHRLTLAFINDNPDAIGAISALRAEFGDLEFAAVPKGWKSLASAVRLVTGESCTLSYFRSEALRTRLRDRIRTGRYDLVLVSSSSMIQYALEIDQPIPMVMDLGEVDSAWWMDQADRGSFPSTRFFRTEGTRLRRAEAAAVKRAGHCVVASPRALATLKSFAPDAPVALIPDGIDADALTSGPSRGNASTIVLSTRLADQAAIRDVLEFSRAVMPGVRTWRPDARLVIVSKDSPAEGVVAELAGTEVVAPATDIRPVLHRAVVAVAPARSGCDQRVALLEPMAAGLPVVATPQAIEGSGVSEGSEVLVAKDWPDFALKVVRLLENQEQRAGLGARAREFVESHFTWHLMTARLSEVITAVTKAGASPSRPESEPLAPIRR